MSQFPNPADPNLGVIPPYTPQVSERDAAIEELNSLLRGEISAAETYTMAIDEFEQRDKSHVVDVQALREIQEEHGRACQKLRERVRELGGTPSNSSGAWGAWAKTVEGTASLFGDRAALKGLKEGEEHGLKQYNNCCDEVDTASAQLIASELIPAQHRHIDLLNKMMGSNGKA